LVVPDGKVSVGNNATTDADNAFGLFVDYERRLIPWLGLDFQLLYAVPTFKVNRPPIAGPQFDDTTSVDVGTVTAGVNFHLLGGSRFDLYLGAFGGYTRFDRTVDDAYSYGGVLGFDIGLAKKGLVLTTSVRYSVTNADSLRFPGFTIPYDPFVCQLGLGRRF
jgi:hypothetical protein